MAARVIGNTLGSRSLTSLVPLLVALACSAGGGDSEGPPAFAGSLGGAGTNSNANTNAPSGTNTPAAPNGSSQTAAAGPNNGAGGSSSSNEGQSGNIGIAPAQNQNQNQSQSSAPASGGAPATSMSPGANAGAAGQTTMPPAMGASGSASMPAAGGAAGQTTPTNPPAAASNADCPTQFFCDGFENVAAGAGSAPASPLWKVIDDYSVKTQSDDNVQISTANAHSGKQAVRISSTSSRTGIQAQLPQSTYFIRAWLQVDAVPRGPVLIGLGTDQNAETRLRIFNQSWATINAVPGDGVAPNGATSGNCPDCVTLATNRWFCAEMGIDSNAKTATLWIDGVQAATLANAPSQPAQPNMFIGNMALEGGQTGVLIDDVVAGPARIGCN